MSVDPQRPARWILLALLLIACSGSPPGVVEKGPRAPTYPPDAAQRLLHQPDSLVEGAHYVLFVGNSYVYYNELPAQYAALLAHAWPSPMVKSVTPGGYRLVEHARDAATPGSELARLLDPDAPNSSELDVLVLQEQSQIGGFGEESQYRLESVAGAQALAEKATELGAATVLYLTWGRRNGDDSIEGWGTYVAMQDALDHGYLEMARTLRETGHDIRVAPVGGGFRIIYEKVLEDGGDPLDDTSEFSLLFDGDGSHPSARGSFLAACIIAATITNADPHDFALNLSLGEDVASGLREVCALAVGDQRWKIPG